MEKEIIKETEKILNSYRSNNIKKVDMGPNQVQISWIEDFEYKIQAALLE